MATAASKEHTTKWLLPKNCKCGKCMKSPSFFQMKCCEHEKCITEDEKYMNTMFKKVDETSQQFELPELPQLEWYFNSLYDPDRLLATLKRKTAYEEYVTYEAYSQAPPGCPPKPARHKPDAVPRCVIRRIKEKFPDPKGKYTGFNTSNTLADLYKAFCNDTENDNDAYESLMKSESKALTRIPRMCIIARIVSFECFVNDAMRLAADAVCYDLGHVTETDYKNFLENAQKEATLKQEVRGYLQSLNDSEVMDEESKEAKNLTATAKRPKNTSEQSLSAVFPWQTIRAALKIKLRGSKHMEEIESSNFLQTILDEKKKKIVKMNKPILCDIMHCLRKLLNSVYDKDLAKDEIDVHFMCLPQPTGNGESKKIRKLLIHLIETNGYFNFSIHSSKSSSGEHSAPTSSDNASSTAKEEIKIKIRPTNIEALCHIACLFYGIRCLYCHGNGDKTIETGVLTEQNCSKAKILFKEDPGTDTSEAKEFLISLLDKARKDKTQLDADRLTYRNMASFYEYLARLLIKACMCLVYYCNEKKIVFGKEYIKKSFSEELNIKLEEIKDAIKAMTARSKSLTHDSRSESLASVDSEDCTK